MGNTVLNFTYNAGTKVLSGTGIPGDVLRVYIDDAADRVLQGGNAPAAATTLTVAGNGTWTYNSTALALGAGPHLVRFKTASDHVTQNYPFTV